jgi:MFS family permease
VLFNLHRIIGKIGKSRVFILAIFSKIVFFFFILTLPQTWLIIPFLIAYIIAGAVEWTSLDVILESYSQDKLSGRIRGIYLSIINAGYILGPYLSTRILEKYGYSGVFNVLLIFNVIIFLAALLGLRKVSYEYRQKINFKEILGKFLKRRNIMRIYYVAFVLDFFYAVMTVYTPIYLRELGLAWSEIGVIFAFMLVPFVLLQYPAGLLADKKYGEKGMIILFLLIMAIATLLIFFIKTKAIFVWALVLFATRVGAAVVEVLRDSYFYKRIDCGDVDLIDLFRTSSSVGFIVAMALATVLLLVFHIRILFFVTSIIVFSAILPAAMLQNNKCERDLNKNA